MNINAALGMVERPLQVGDWVECVDVGDWQSLSLAKWPQRVRFVDAHGRVSFDDRVGPWSTNRFRRVDPPRDEVAELREQVRILNEICDDIRDTFGYSRDDMVDLTTYVAEDYAELKEQLSQATKERDELKLQVENDRVVIEEMNRQADQWSKRYRDVRGERDEAREILGLAVGRSEETLTHIVAQLREHLATAQAEAAKMREDVNVQYGKAQLAVDKEKAKSSHMRKVLEYIHAIGGCGLNVHERVDAALNTPAGRELLDELKAKDERIADLERQLAERDRDAELRRELRAWIKNGVFSVVGYSVVIGCQCIPTELAELLISIRDGGAK